MSESNKWDPKGYAGLCMSQSTYAGAACHLLNGHGRYHVYNGCADWVETEGRVLWCTRMKNHEDPHRGADGVEWGEKTHRGHIEEFETGARRESIEKLHPWHAVAWLALKDLVDIVYAEGGQKYPDAANYKLGIPTKESFEHLCNHLALVMTGDIREEHWLKIAWNALCIYQTIKQHPELDNLERNG